MDTHQIHSNMPGARGEHSCYVASGQDSCEATNSDKSNLCEGFGGPTAVGENSRSEQTQADSLEISVGSQLSGSDKPTKIVFNSSKLFYVNLTINDLPDEMLLAIFSYMSFNELLNVIPNVCSHWKSLSQDAELWQDKVYEVRTGMREEEVVQTLQMLPQLRTLVLCGNETSSVFQALCANCHELTTLDIYCTQILSYSEWKNLVNKCTKIHTLRIPMRLLADGRCVEAMLQLSHLRVLHFTNYRSDTTKLQLSALADSCQQLCDLDLSLMPYKIKDMEYFLNSKRHILKRICVGWTSVCGRYVGSLLSVCADTLENLELYDCIYSRRGGGDEAYVALGKLHNLKVLIMESPKSDPIDVLHLVFKNGHLSKLKQLKFVHGGGIKDEAIIAISRGCPALRELTLHSCDELTDAAFMDIHHLKQLEILCFVSCRRLRGRTIPCIARLPALHTLRFYYVRFERLQPGLDCILYMSGLRCLYINGSVARAIPFDRFPGRLVSLRELHLEYCEGDQHILDEVCRQMPDLKVCGELVSALLYTDSD